MGYTKLDVYDYVILPGTIRIGIADGNDPVLVDILSELTMTSGRVYVEGMRFQYLDQYHIEIKEGESFIDLSVERIDDME